MKGVPDISGVSFAYSASRRLTRMRCKMKSAPPIIRASPATPPTTPPAIAAVSDFEKFGSTDGVFVLSAALVPCVEVLDEDVELSLVEDDDDAATADDDDGDDSVNVTEAVVVSIDVSVSIPALGEEVIRAISKEPLMSAQEKYV